MDLKLQISQTDDVGNVGNVIDTQSIDEASESMQWTADYEDSPLPWAPLPPYEVPWVDSEIKDPLITGEKLPEEEFLVTSCSIRPLRTTDGKSKRPGQVVLALAAS